jgi:hypothetical protein
MPRYSLKKLFLAVAVVAIGLVVLSSLVRFLEWIDPFNQMAFSANAWEHEPDQSRAAMAHDLIRHHLPAGLSRAEVESLLGSPYDVFTSKDAGGIRCRGAMTYRYRISGDIAGYDDAFVYVHFDEKEKVIGAEINGY